MTREVEIRDKAMSALREALTSQPIAWRLVREASDGIARVAFETLRFPERMVVMEELAEGLQRVKGLLTHEHTPAQPGHIEDHNVAAQIFQELNAVLARYEEVKL